MNQEDAATSLPDRILLPWRGRRVEQIVVDYRLVLRLDQDAELALESPALLSIGLVDAPRAAAVRIDPETADVAPALALLHTTILSSVAFHSGSLRVVFSSGHHLNVEAGDKYEAWDASGPGSFKCVSLPGGSLAHWS
jgi:hypothetical protein